MSIRRHRFSLVAAFAVSVVLAFSTSVLAHNSGADFTVFQKNYTRTTAKPVAVKDTFTVLNSQTTWIVKVSEENPQGHNDDTNFVISLNGKQILKSGRCDRNSRSIEEKVTLKTSNTLLVELRGKPGSAIKVQVIGYDSTPPKVKWLKPNDNQPFTASSVALSLQLKEDISGVDPESLQILLDGQSIRPQFPSLSTPTLSATLNANVNLSEGVHELTAKVKNLANLEDKDKISVMIDQTPPVIGQIKPADGKIVEKSKVKVRVQYSDNASGIDVRSVRLKLDHQDVTSLAEIKPNHLKAVLKNLEPGSHTLTVELKDKVGLVAVKSSTFQVITDPNLQDRDDDGYSTDAGDCNDENSAIHPGAEDLPENGVDENCDGVDTLKPKASISIEPASIILGQSATLNWQCSQADSCSISPDLGIVDFNGAMSVSPTTTTTYTITATGAGETVTSTATLTVIIPPTADIMVDPPSILVGQSAALSWQCQAADTCSISPEIGVVGASGMMDVSPVQTTTYTVTATGPGGTITKSTTLTVQAIKPTVTISANPQTIISGTSARLSWNSINASSVHIDHGIGLVAQNDSLNVSPKVTTTYVITATGSLGSASAMVTVYVTGTPTPPLEGTFGAQYQSLIPADSTVTEYDVKRFAVIRGLVKGQDGLPISQVQIVVQNNRQYGTVKTDINGQFSIPVDINGTVNISFQKAGLISTHRQVQVMSNDVAVVETVTMLAEDSKVTEIALDGNSSNIFVHQSTPVTDVSGTRQANVVIGGDNKAYAVDEHGNDIFELTKLNVRATEFTTPESMPAVLPPTSAFTYCVELKADGVERVRFKDPVVLYVDNFLGFNVGEIVPVGYYDRDRGVWVPSDNGRVVKLLDLNSDGIVDALDSDGDSLPNDLNSNGDYSDEVKGLTDSAKYTPGKTFWRVSVKHFTPWDCNWPMIPPAGAIPPNASGTAVVDQQKKKDEDCDKQTNSFVNCRSRVYHEDIAIPGTGLSLHYASNRVPDYKTVITVPASGATVPPSLKRIVVRLKIAGRTFEQTLPPSANQTAEFIWDGLDYLGQRVDSALANIAVEFVYNETYTGFGSGSEPAAAFGLPGVYVTTVVGRGEFLFTQRDNILIHNQSQIFQTLAEGWTLSNHHNMSSKDLSTLYKGNGDVVSSHASNIITTIAGTGSLGYNGNGIPAITAWLDRPNDVSIDQKGNIYIVESKAYRIRKVDTNGIITTKFDGSGLSLNKTVPRDVIADPSENIYFTDSGKDVIFRMDNLARTLTVFAGRIDQSGYSGDGGPALYSKLQSPNGLALDQSGNIYVADSGNGRIRKIDPGGIITTVAGNGTYGFSGDGGLAISAQLLSPVDVAVDYKGNIYILEGDLSNSRIRKVDSSGIITTVATLGTGVAGLAVDQDENIYVAGRFNNRILKIDSSGIITTVAGTGFPGYSGDGGLAVEAKLDDPVSVAVDSNYNIYVADTGNNRIRKITAASSFAAAASPADMTFTEEGLGYIFSLDGKHRQTVDLDTQKVLEQFAYDPAGRLISSTDLYGNQLTIERNAAGVPTAIVSPDGLRTTLSIDANSHLKQITLPDGTNYKFDYTTGGLMTKETEPKGNFFTHTFDVNGRITDINDQEGGHEQFAQSIAVNTGDVTTTVTSGEGDVVTYLDQSSAGGAATSTISVSGVTNPTIHTRSTDGLNIKMTLPDATIQELQFGLDPENKFKFLKSGTITTPAGLKAQVINTRVYTDTNTDQKKDLITHTTSLNGKTATLKHNVLTSTFTASSPLNRTQTTTYDPLTLLTSKVSVPGFWDTLYTYDLKGRLKTVKTGTRTMSIDYDLAGNVQSVTDPKGSRTTYEYDAVGRTKVIHRPDLTDVRFNYDDNGNMTVLTNPSNRNHGYIYNNVNLVTSYTPPLSPATQYFYDKERRLTEVNFPSGRQIKNIYTGVLLTKTETPEGPIDFAYLPSGQLGSITKGSESVTTTYDGGLLKTAISAGTLAQTLALTYNNDLNVIGLTYAGATNNFGYDNDGLLTTSGRFTISRNAQNGLPMSVTGGALNLSRSFNTHGEPTTQTQIVNSSAAGSWTVTYNDNGQIATKSETVGGVTANYVYTYDSVGRLTKVEKDGTLVEEYRYTGTNPLGTRTWEMNSLRGIAGRSLTYNDEDQLLNVGGTTYQYDADGSLSRKTDTAGVTTYNYSSRGELLSTSLPTGQTIEYVHDPLGRRIAKKINGTTTEKYLWAGLTQLLAVYDGSNNLLMRFEYSDGRMPNVMTKGSATYYLTYDQVGSLRGVYEATGAIVKRIDYDSFGNILTDTAPAFSVPFGFAGGLHDRDTGLVRFGYRDYDPTTGRWTAKDPIGFAGGDVDLYGYVENDPINFIDPPGLYKYETSDVGVAFLHESNPFNSDSTLRQQIRSWGYFYTGQWDKAAATSGQSIVEKTNGPCENSSWQNWYTGTQITAGTAAITAGSFIALEAAGINYAGALSIDHAVPRMIERGISMKDVNSAIKLGKNFYDPKNNSLVSIYGDTGVARAWNGVIKTVFKANKNPSPNWIAH